MTNVVAQAAGPVLVLGAAGTGKTTLVVDAVAARIATVRRRAGAGVRGDAAGGVRAARRHRATRRAHHAGAAGDDHPRLLPGAGAPLGRGRGRLPTLLTAPEQEFRIRELLRGWRGSWPAELEAAVGTRAFAQQVRAVLARARGSWVSTPTDVADAGAAAGEPGWVALGEFLAEYLDVLDAEGVIDYAELVHRARILLERAEVAGRRAPRSSARCTSTTGASSTRPRSRWCARLVPDGMPVVALADPDTSIYRFRGAHPRAAAEFVRLFTTRGRRAPRWRCSTPRGGRAQAQAAALASVARRLGAPGGRRRGRAARIAPRRPGQGRGGGVHVPRRGHPGAPHRRRAAGRPPRRRVPGARWRCWCARGAARSRRWRGRWPTPASRSRWRATRSGLASELAVRPLLLALEVAARGRRPRRRRGAPAAAVGLGRLRRRLDPAAGAAAAGGGRRGGGTPAPTLVAEALGGARPVPGEGVDGLADRRDLLAVAAARLIAEGARPDEVLWELWSGTDWPERAAGRGPARRRRRRPAPTATWTPSWRCSSWPTSRWRPAGADGVRWFLAEVAQQQIPADSQRESAVAGRGVRVLTAHRAKGRHWAFTVVAGVQEGVWPDVRRRGSVFDAQRLSVGRAGRGGRRPASWSPASGGCSCWRARGPRGGCWSPRSRAPRARTTARRGSSPSWACPCGTSSSRPCGCTRCARWWPSCAAWRRTRRPPPGLREAAAARLARLADATDDDGRPLVPDADPARWWGLRAPTGLTGPAAAARRCASAPSQLEVGADLPAAVLPGRARRRPSPRGSEHHHPGVGDPRGRRARGHAAS